MPSISNQTFSRLNPFEQNAVKTGNNLNTRQGLHFKRKKMSEASSRNFFCTLHSAVKENDSPEIERLLLHGADVNARDFFNRTPLHVGASESRDDSHYLTNSFLLQYGADVNARDQFGKSPLHYVAWGKNVRTIQLFLQSGADVSLKNSRGETPLCEAIYDGNFEVMKLLVDRGSDVNGRNNCGFTPLHWACMSCDEEIIKLLIKKGADVNVAGSNGCTPLMCMLGHRPSRKSLSYLLKYSDVNIVDYEDKNVLQFVSTKGRHNGKIIVKELARLEAMGVNINQSVLDTVSGDNEYSGYFKLCSEELMQAKSTKIENCWISFLNLLVDSKRKLKNYAGNEEMIENLKKISFLKKFPIYGALMVKNVNQAIQRRRVFDRSSIILSNHLPVFNPNHLIVRDILDCLTLKDYLKLCSDV